MSQGVSSTRHLTLAIGLAFALLAAGCARINSIYRSQSVPTDEPHVVSIDAKQRAVISNPGVNGQPLRFCSEPPPDVFTALATSLAADASLNKEAGRAAAAKLAATISESGATIGRSQTVNILREMMYRTCERFLSGAISVDEFVVQSARDQQLMVQVLAVEQLTGAARAQATALTTVAKAAGSGVTESGIEALAEARKDYEAKRIASETATSDAASQAPKGPCTTEPLNIESPPDGATAEEASAKNEKCLAAKSAMSLAGEARTYLNTIQTAIARQSDVSAHAHGQVSSAALNAATVGKEIAEQVVNIVKQYHVFDEVAMACVVKLRSSEVPLDSVCNDVIRHLVAARAEQMLIGEGIPVAAVELKFQSLRESSDRLAKMVWDYLLKGGGVNDATLTKLANKARVTIPRARVSDLVNASHSFERFAIEFGRLRPDLQAVLSDAAGR